MIWSEEAEEVRRFHRDLRGRHTGDHAQLDHDLYRRNLASLAEQGYMLDDIGVMLGISRERVRQLYSSYGLPRPYAAVHGRLWHEGLARFVPARGVTVKAVRRRLARQRRALAISENQRRMADTLQALAHEIHRTPSLREFATLWAGRPIAQTESAAARIRNWWIGAYRKPGERYADSTKALYAAAGLTVRAVGMPGHLGPLKQVIEAP